MKVILIAYASKQVNCNTFVMNISIIIVYSFFHKGNCGEQTCPDLCLFLEGEISYH